jgi:division protein CdvB (Snf7/Vps24/ESCRT-III family)
MDNLNMKDIDLKNIPIKEFKAEITSGDLIHAMTHAATRDDIANLRTEVKDDISRLDNSISRLDTKIDHVRTELKEDISKLDTKMDSNFKWLIGIIITGIIFSPVSLALVTHFIK